MFKTKTMFVVASGLAATILSICPVIADGPPPGSFSSTFKEPGSTVAPSASGSSSPAYTPPGGGASSAPAFGTPGYASTFGQQATTPTNTFGGAAGQMQSPAPTNNGYYPPRTGPAIPGGYNPNQNPGSYPMPGRNHPGTSSYAGYGGNSIYGGNSQYSTNSQATTSSVTTPANAFTGPFSVTTAQTFSANQDWNGMANYGYCWTQADKSSGDGWYTYGRGLFQLGRYNDAVIALQNATHFSPKQPIFWDGLCAAYTGVGNNAAASQALAEGEAKCAAGQPAVTWYVFGNAAKDLNEYDHAIRDYQKAINIQPNFAQAWNNMGVAHEMKGQPTIALQDYDKSASLGNGMGQENASRMRTAALRAQLPRSNSGGLPRFGTTANPSPEMLNHAIRIERGQAHF